MMNITIETQDNGYAPHAAARMIELFNRAAEKMFPGCTVRHFYYGDRLDMVDVVIGNGLYAHFNITENRVSLCGWTCSTKSLEKFMKMTYRDNLYAGELLEI